MRTGSQYNTTAAQVGVRRGRPGARMEIGKEGKPDFGLDDQQEDKVPALPPIPILISWRNNGEWREGVGRRCLTL